MVELFAYFAGYIFFFALVAFAVILWRQKARLPMTLGFIKLAGVFVVVWLICFATFACFQLATAISGFPNRAGFESSYGVLAGVAGYLLGTKLLDRMLRKP